jgi:site-specific recombinase XerD
MRRIGVRRTSAAEQDRMLAAESRRFHCVEGWLGHRSITSTAVYTALAPNRFKDFWRD